MKKMILISIVSVLFSAQAFGYATGKALETLMLQTGTCYGPTQKRGVEYNFIGYTFLPNGQLEFQTAEYESDLKAYNSAYSNAAGSTGQSARTVMIQWRVRGDQVHIKLSSGWKNLVVNFAGNPQETTCNYYDL